MEDTRFSHIVSDPKFRHVPKATKKVKIDKRFQSMFKDKRFSVKYTVDKYGRPINHTSKEDLKRYYELSSEESEAEEICPEAGKYVRARKRDDDGTVSEDKTVSDLVAKTPKKSLRNDTAPQEQEEDSVLNSDKVSECVPKTVVKGISRDGSIIKDQECINSHEELDKYKSDGIENTSDSDSSAINEKSSELENNVQNLHQTDKSDKTIPLEVKKKLRDLNIDYARGQGRLFSESSSDDESCDEISDAEVVEHKWGELDADAETVEEATYRLAACNMDWDRIRAMDLMVLLNSFLPPGGSVKSVIIYPSKFGKQRMQEEEVKGPLELVEPNRSTEDKEDAEEGANYHMEKLRQYQLNRLKYYYAVITFDSTSTADSVYKECDGMEYESSATKLDLRFIPDDMTFDDEPKEVCDTLPDLTKYQPRCFTTTALQQAKVDLTWDETNPDRIELTKKLSSGKVDSIEDTDLQNYIASSTDDESKEDEESNSENKSADTINKYRSLLQEIEEEEKKKNEKDIQMEVFWDVGLEKRSEKLVQKKLEEKEEKTPFQKYLEKRKMKRKEMRESKKILQENEGSESDSDLPDGIDMNDPYFAEEFNKSEFRKKTKTKTKKETTVLHAENEQNNAELQLLLMDEDDSNKHFSLKKIQEQEKGKKKKGKKKEKEKKINSPVTDDFMVNVNDQRFSALFTSNNFNIDPTNPNFKKTKAMEILIKEKIKRKHVQTESVPEKKSKFPIDRNLQKDSELSVLVKSVKKKTQL